MKIYPTRLPLRNLIRPFLAVIGIVLGFIVLSSCSSSETPVPAPSPKPKEVEIIRDQFYHTDGADEHLLDIYIPNQIAGPYPTLLLIHGGNGDKKDMVIWGQNFARKGYAAISINHRQYPDFTYPAHVEDAFCALAWIIKSADVYAFDPDQIVVMGHSAGGTLAATLGVINKPDKYLENCPHVLKNNDSIKGVIAFTVIFDYLSAAAESPNLEEYTIDLLGGSFEDIPEIWQEASAVNWIDRNDPPFLLIHGGDDQSISPEQSIQAAEILTNAGVAVELLLIPGASHMQIKGSSQSLDAVEKFLSEIIQ